VAGYGLHRLQAIHGYLFQDICAWAGQVRTAPSSKRADNGTISVFEHLEAIAPKLGQARRKTNHFASAKDGTIDDQRGQRASVFVEANRIRAL